MNITLALGNRKRQIPEIASLTKMLNFCVEKQCRERYKKTPNVFWPPHTYPGECTTHISTTYDMHKNK